MTTISPLDRLFIRVTQNGVLQYFAELTGVSSFSDIINSTRHNLKGVCGMTVFDIRNSTCGWSTSRSVLLMN